MIKENIKIIEEYIQALGLENNLKKHSTMIKTLEQNGSKVFHVIEGEYILGGIEVVRMTSYCMYTKEDYQTEEDVQYFIANMNDGYVFTFTVNHDFQIEEYGDIAFKIVRNQMVRVS